MTSRLTMKLVMISLEAFGILFFLIVCMFVALKGLQTLLVTFGIFALVFDYLDYVIM